MQQQIHETETTAKQMPDTADATFMNWNTMKCDARRCRDLQALLRDTIVLLSTCAAPDKRAVGVVTHAGLCSAFQVGQLEWPLLC